MQTFTHSWKFRSFTKNDLFLSNIWFLDWMESFAFSSNEIAICALTVDTEGVWCSFVLSYCKEGALLAKPFCSFLLPTSLSWLRWQLNVALPHFDPEVCRGSNAAPGDLLLGACRRRVTLPRDSVAFYLWLFRHVSVCSWQWGGA